MALLALAPGAARAKSGWWSSGEFSTPPGARETREVGAPTGSGPTVTISVDRTRSTPLAANLSGTNVTTESSPASFGDPAVRSAVKWLLPTVLRWPGGTVDDCFSWSTGRIAAMGTGVAGAMAPLDVEAAVFGRYPQIGFSNQIVSMATKDQPLIAGKGGNPLGDQNTGFGGFANAVGAKFLVVVNTISDTTESAERLATTVARLGLPVLGFELSNEPFFVTIPRSDGPITLPDGAPPVPGAFADGGDYLAKMRPYYDAIKRGYVDAGVDPARAVVAIAGGYAAEDGGWNAQWSRDLSGYASASGAWWDTVAYHYYPPKERGGGFPDAMTYANDALVTGTDGFMRTYRATNWSAGKPLFVSEYAATFDDKAMNGSVYAGIFVAEYAARMSDYPETAAVLMHQLLDDQDGVASPKASLGGSSSWTDQLRAMGSSGRAFDTTGAMDGLYLTAQVLGLHVVDRAVRWSDRSFATTVGEGGGVVPTLGASIPAVYAKAFHGRDGRTHLLMTNKGSSPVNARVLVDGVEPATGETVVWMAPSAGDPGEQNTSASQTVGLHMTTVKGAFSLPAYSVAHLDVAP